MPSRPHSIYIEDSLWDFLVGHAAKRQQSVGALVNEALREALMFRRPAVAMQENPDAGQQSDTERQPSQRRPTPKAGAVAPETGAAGGAVAEAQPVEEDFFKRRDRERVEAARRKLEAKK